MGEPADERSPSLVDRVPNELLLAMIELSLDYQPSLVVFSNVELVDTSTVDPVAANPFQLIASSVCKRWRALLLSNPRFWSVLSLTVNSLGHPSRAAYVKMWLERTGEDIPLYIRILHLQYFDGDKGQLKAVIEVMNEYASRWKVLDLHMPLQFLGHLKLPKNVVPPMLESFSFLVHGQSSLRSQFGPHATVPSFEIDINARPPLQRLLLTGVHLQSLGFDYRHLKEVSLRRFGLSKFLELLKRAPELVKARFHLDHHEDDGIAGIFPATNLQSIQVTHKCLAYLEFIWEAVSETLIWDCMTLPALKSLELEVRKKAEVQAPSISRFATRSGCQIQRLKLSDIPADPQVLQFLDDLPALENLLIYETDDGQVSYVVDFILEIARARERKQGSRFLQNLQSLFVSGHTGVDQFEPVVRSLFWPKKSAADAFLGPLEQVDLNLVVRNKRGLQVPLEVLRGWFSELTEVGADITLDDQYGCDYLKDDVRGKSIITGSILDIRMCLDTEDSDEGGTSSGSESE